MTMTIVGYDPRAGQFGGAVATKNPAVGSRVLRGMGEVGMVGFSSVVNPNLSNVLIPNLNIFPKTDNASCSAYFS